MSLSIRHSKESPSSDMKLRCYTCLSLDRNLKLLKNEQICLLATLCPEMFSKAKLHAHYLICWECEFMITKIKQFQARLTKAHLRITLTLQGVKTIVEGLSTLKITAVETITITPQAPQIIATNPNQQILIEIPHPHPTIPAPLKLEPETIKIEVEEEDKCAGEISGDSDELIQLTKIQGASSDESTDTASEIDMYDDPLMTQKQKKPKVIMKCAKIAVPPQKALKPAINAPNVKFNCRPQKVFINERKEKFGLRGNQEVVKVTSGVPKLGTRKESVPILVKSKSVSIVVKDEGSVSTAVKDKGSLPIPVKDERTVPMLVKSKGRVSIVGKGKGRSVANRLKGNVRRVPNRVKAPTLSKREELILKQSRPNNSDLRRESPPKQSQPREPECEQIPGIYGYDEYEVKCIILNRTELNAFRDKQRSKIGYKGHGFNCDRCIEKFMNQKNLDEHNRKHAKSRGNSACELCEQRFPNDSERDEHYKQHFVVFECLQCPYQNSDRVKISEHIRRNHEVSLFDCKKCDAFFKTYKEKRRHRVEVHSNRERQRCEECNKTFSTLSLKTHMATHERETTECPVCQKKVRKNYLDKHIKIHNDTGEDSAYCVDCEKTYKSQKSYHHHLKTSLKHNTVEKVGIKCDHCNKYFTGTTALKNHLEEVSGVKYTCDICKKDSKNKTILARHIRFVHKGQKPQLNPKICEYCGKTFSIKKSLEQHINKHLGHRPLVCKDCGATFIYSAALFTHRRLVHKVKRRYEMPS